MITFGDTLTIDNILKQVSPYQIFKYYCPRLEIGKTTNSPLRNDKHASFGLFVGDTGDIIFNDLRGGASGNWVSFLIRLYGLEFYDVLRMVNRDMQLGLMDYNSGTLNVAAVSSKIVKDINPKDHNRNLILHVRPRPWAKHDIKYWTSYGITKDIIGKDTFPITSYWFNSWGTKLAEQHAYCYDFYFDGEILRRKIYQPYSKTDKWKTNLNSLVIDGIKDIPKEGNLLIITKSRKDRLVLKSLGYTAIATNNESSWIPDVNFEKLKLRYKRIVIFFDNDDAGMTNSAKFAEKYGIERVYIQDFSDNIQDIADYRQAYGKDRTIKLLKELL